MGLPDGRLVYQPDIAMYGGCSHDPKKSEGNKCVRGGGHKMFVIGGLPLDGVGGSPPQFPPYLTALSSHQPTCSILVVPCYHIVSSSLSWHLYLTGPSYLGNNLYIFLTLSGCKIFIRVVLGSGNCKDDEELPGVPKKSIPKIKVFFCKKSWSGISSKTYCLNTLGGLDMIL